MSFLPISEENTQAPTGQTQGGVSGAPPVQGGSAGAGQAGGGATGASTGSPTQFGSSASKLGDYLNANAPQIQGQANKVVSGLNQQYGQVGQDITNAANQFGQSVQGGYAAPNQDLVNQAVANPTQFASNPDNVKAFQSQYNNSYSGPTSYESSQPYGAIQGEVNQAVQNAGLLNTQAGLGNYLGQTQGGNQTRASNTLDTLLLQGNPGAQQQIQQAAGQFQNLTPQFQQSVTGADQSVQAAQKAAQDAKAYAQGQFGTAANAFNTGLQNAGTDAQNKTAAYNNALNQFYSQATPIEQQINAYLGTLPNNAGSNVQDLFAPVISGNKLISTPPTLASVATPDQYAEANALAQLGGQAYTSPLNQANIGQAGTAVTPTANIPTIQSLLQQYQMPLANATNVGMGGNGSGWGPTQSNIWSQEGSLANYLNQFDPTDYYTTPGSLNGFGSVQI